MDCLMLSSGEAAAGDGEVVRAAARESRPVCSRRTAYVLRVTRA